MTVDRHDSFAARHDWKKTNIEVVGVYEILCREKLDLTRLASSYRAAAVFFLTDGERLENLYIPCDKPLGSVDTDKKKSVVASRSEMLGKRQLSPANDIQQNIEMTLRTIPATRFT